MEKADCFSLQKLNGISEISLPVLDLILQKQA